MDLQDLLHAVPVLQVKGSMERTIHTVQFDSREVSKGDVFVAIKGERTDGHNYLNQAIEKGAETLVVEEFPIEIDDKVCYVLVQDTSYVLGLLADNFCQQPSKKLKLVGVTGTNGKTTVATLLYQLFRSLGYKAALISTVENKIDDTIYPTKYTTPDPLTINGFLKEAVDQGCDYCFMEVSSHAVVQQRIAGLRFSGGIFTNLSHDHLDFHETFANYIAAKKRFFDNLDRNAFALVNIDDKHGAIMQQNTFAYKKSYALKGMADFKVKVLESHFEGMLLQIDGHELWVKLVGKFNAYNLLAVYGAAILLEQETVQTLTALSQVVAAEGRFETLRSDGGVFGIVDYAHTPDALENVLLTVRDLRKDEQKIITVVGCGGDRDKTKRPEMARVAAELSDSLILTSDNPRTEEPAAIIKDMEAGLEQADRKKVFSITDRREAIRAACHIAKPGDVILVAGKGHENYQEINGERTHFDDMEELKMNFNEQ